MPSAAVDDPVDTRPAYLSALETIVADIVAPRAIEVDRDSVFPREALGAMGEAGLLGLVSAPDVGGLGEGFRAAACVVGELAGHCASTAMVVMMHYAASAVIEAHGPLEVRQAIAAGDYGGGAVLGLLWLAVGYALLSQHDVSVLLRTRRK